MLRIRFRFFQLFVSIMIIFIDFINCVDERTFIVKIQVKSHEPSDSNCAGTILTHNAVLTAAHCIRNANTSNASVEQFSKGGSRRHDVVAIAVHPGFDIRTLENDVALLKIAPSLGAPWKAVILNNVKIRNSLRVYRNCVMVGWLSNDEAPLMDGEKNKSRLRDSKIEMDGSKMTLTHVPVTLITVTECSKKIKNFGGSFHGNEKLCGISQRDEQCSIGSGGPLLCPVKRDICHVVGDRTRSHLKTVSSLEYEKIKYVGLNDTLGDPLDLLGDLHVRSVRDAREKRCSDGEFYQLGVVSWGKICSKIPGVFVRTDAYFDWIQRNVADMDRNNCLRSYTSVFDTASESAATSGLIYHIFLLYFLVPLLS